MAKQITINTSISQFLLIGLPDDAYRLGLVTNKELKDRYGNLEYTTRDNGNDCRVLIADIENYELLGIYNNIENKIDFEAKDEWFGQEYRHGNILANRPEVFLIELFRKETTTKYTLSENPVQKPTPRNTAYSSPNEIEAWQNIWKIAEAQVRPILWAVIKKKN